MKILPLLVMGAMLAACEPLLPVDREDDADFGAADQMQAAPGVSIIDTAPVAGTDWLLARVGWPNDRRDASASSSSYAGVAVANIVILDKETGASISLLPNERNIVRDHRIIWPVAGVVASGTSTFDEGAAPVPTHFVLDAELRDNRGRANPASRRLLIGGLDDFSSSLVARGYARIHHMEMLDQARLSILLGYPDRDELLVVDLQEKKIELRKWVDPARPGR
ncbi:hypothetical protein [Alteriqipengyuania sp.]|uniref:hypothetical protein n=1 Tax=Alteriqipengyuania sp. TaxID=2800692 RepID=UPI0035113C73